MNDELDDTYKEVDQSYNFDGTLPPMIDKEEIKSLRFNLSNIVIVLREVFKRLDVKDLKEKDLVLAIGNTGSGKSTMFSALVFGPEKLHEQILEEQFLLKLANG